MSDDEEIPTLIVAETAEPDLSKKVPLTIITGFLGAGKSTLLKYILTERHGYRIAVIMNEFADSADIESRAINVGTDTQELLELPNGCLCCSIKDQGAAAIEDLMRRRGAFDYILLETTGLADPGPIAGMFWLNEEYGKGRGWDIGLDGVVCVVDGVYGLQQLAEDHASPAQEDGRQLGESIRQLASADVALINKSDIASSSQLSELEAALHAINPALITHRTVRGEIDLSKIIGIKAYASAPPAGVEEEHVHDEHCGHENEKEEMKTHYAARGISSLTLPCPPLTPERLEALDAWLRTLLWDRTLPAPHTGVEVDVLRTKGLVPVVGGRRRVLQGVREMYELEEVEDEDGQEVGEGKLVFIGRGLGGEVKESLERVLHG
ncbi:cobW-domain-containing protein [Peniophora sp. CONT]|nr:cobW-domain-containing protein [Peniophora sp. CONT]